MKWARWSYLGLSKSFGRLLETSVFSECSQSLCGSTLEGFSPITSWLTPLLVGLLLHKRGAVMGAVRPRFGILIHTSLAS